MVNFNDHREHISIENTIGWNCPQMNDKSAKIFLTDGSSKQLQEMIIGFVGKYQDQDQG